jgi:hypothetical protein
MFNKQRRGDLAPVRLDGIEDLIDLGFPPALLINQKLLPTAKRSALASGD